MLETAIVAFTTFFATIGPLDVTAIFAGLTAKAAPQHRRAMALKGTFIAAIILLSFILFGRQVLEFLGITLPALRTAGGILLLLIAIDMVFARHSGGTSATPAETREASHKTDISAFPLATPLIAGPGAMGAAILLTTGTKGDVALTLVVILALLLALAIQLALLLLASQVQKYLGITAINVITRVVGVLLAALAVQFMFEGIAGSGVFGRPPSG